MDKLNLTKNRKYDIIFKLEQKLWKRGVNLKLLVREKKSPAESFLKIREPEGSFGVDYLKQ